ncbi:MAG: hypothetical protein IKJ80_01250 [Clostridia bacterium]|nr:hypothetical protein [Clostridia bacterium]
MTENIVETTKAEEITTENISLDYIFTQIDKIVSNTAHITEALEILKSIQSIGPEDIGAEEKAKGIADVVRARETTNQQLLAFYTRVYTDLTAPKKDPITTRVELIKNLRLSALKELKGCYSEDELVERADSILYDISSFCNDIFSTENKI